MKRKIMIAAVAAADFCGDCDSFRFGADTGINLRNRNDLL